MTCKERILSNDYADGVVDFPVEELITEESNACFIPLDDRYSVVYQNRNLVPDLLESIYQYRYVPHLYGLMQIEGGQTPGSRATLGIGSETSVGQAS